MYKILSLSTRGETEFIDITGEVKDAVNSSGMEEGLAIVYSKHTTTAIALNEGESGLLEDYSQLLEKLVPRGRGYRHDRIDNNAHSHLRSLLLGNQKVIPVLGSRLTLGTWQSIFFVELDGPRRREAVIQVVGKNVEEKFP